MLSWKSVDVACRLSGCRCWCLLNVRQLVCSHGLVDGSLQLVVEAGLSASSVLTVGRSCGVRSLLLPRVLKRCGLLLLRLSGLYHLMYLLLLLLRSAGGQHLVSIHPL